MILLNNVTKVYKGETYETKALDHVNLKINRGEFIAVMGASGSGKTTLLNILGCMDTLSEGEYFIDNIEVHSLNSTKLHEVRKEKISFVFQHFALMNSYTVYENVELPLRAKNIKKSKRKEIIHDKLSLMGIANLASKYPTQISGGQQQRVAIARALASNNNIILADEPTGALDKQTGKELMNALTDINKLGKTIILVTHDDNVAAYADRIIQISDGKVVEDYKNEK